MRPKITIVGSGTTGTSAAMWLAAREVGDIVLVDIIEGLPQGRALDLAQSAPIAGASVSVVGTTGYAETAASDVCVIMSGVARKPGMTREQLLDTNAGIVRSVTEQVLAHSPDAVLVVFTNPLDAMTYLVAKTSGLPRTRVVGESGSLDRARFRAFLAQAAGVSPRDVQAIVIGAHTDTDMVPLPRFASVAGVPASTLLGPDELAAVVARTRRGGAEITELAKASAFIAPGAAIGEMVESIVRDQRRVIPCSILLDGEYGLRDVCVGVPVVLGRNGVERVIELPLDEAERHALRASADAVRELIAGLHLATA